MDLHNRTAVITGAAGGIGLGIARACLDEGMRVMASDLDAERLRETTDALREAGGRVVDHPCDVRDLQSVDDLRDAALAEFGSVDLVCNNAGVGLARPLLETTDADWRLLLDVNIGGVANGVRSFLPLMVEQGGGHLNATASLSGLIGDPDLAIYNATKFAVVGLMESLALEMLRDHPGVTCSVLCPGPVATDLMATSDRMLVDAGSTDSLTDGRNDQLAGYLAAGLQPDEIGRMVVSGIVAGDFWLLPHPDLTFGLLDDRQEAMRRRRLFHAGDWTLQK